MLFNSYHDLYQRLVQHIPEKRLFHDDLSLLAFGTDASFYRLIPRLAVRANTEDEVQLILRNCSELCLPVTFRGNKPFRSDTLGFRTHYAGPCLERHGDPR